MRSEDCSCPAAGLKFEGSGASHQAEVGRTLRASQVERVALGAGGAIYETMRLIVEQAELAVG